MAICNVSRTKSVHKVPCSSHIRFLYDVLLLYMIYGEVSYHFPYLKPRKKGITHTYVFICSKKGLVCNKIFPLNVGCTIYVFSKILHELLFYILGHQNVDLHSDCIFTMLGSTFYHGTFDENAVLLVVLPTCLCHPHSFILATNGSCHIEPNDIFHHESKFSKFCGEKMCKWLL